MFDVLRSGGGCFSRKTTTLLHGQWRGLSSCVVWVTRSEYEMDKSRGWEVVGAAGGRSTTARLQRDIVSRDILGPDLLETEWPRKDKNDQDARQTTYDNPFLSGNHSGQFVQRVCLTQPLLQAPPKFSEESRMASRVI